MSVKDRISELRNKLREEVEKITDSSLATNFRNKYLSKKSELSSISSELASLPPDERKESGALLNEVRNEVEELYNAKLDEITLKELNERLKAEAIDFSVPGRDSTVGALNPFYIVENEIIDIFTKMGYEVVEGPEVETEDNNFTLLNIPSDHPARDMQDTFFLREDGLLLRTQTSSMQVRTMAEKAGAPFKIICPGKTYRRDDDDATHSHQFAQVEGLLVDHDISMAHLKGTLELFLKSMFGEKREIRMTPSYFPFTEPSVEVAVSCFNCNGKGCSMCKGTGYIEVLGAGMVHPHVLEMNGYDPKEYSGFAFGIGIERIAMLRYGIDDIRRLYTNDVRFLHQFTKQVK
ncbi:MAG: phenylalanine--tRNA ligase subunit alpha [Coprobacillus sp.]|nr:phenylalanine--tRNA ligase subunit alpha [Coprobacillus sp.]